GLTTRSRHQAPPLCVHAGLEGEPGATVLDYRTTRSSDGTRCNSATANGYSLKSIAASTPVLVVSFCSTYSLMSCHKRPFAHLMPEGRSGSGSHSPMISICRKVPSNCKA